MPGTRRVNGHEFGIAGIRVEEVAARVERRIGRGDAGAERARGAGLLLGASAASVAEARDAEGQGAAYIGAGPIWATPTKPDAGQPLGLDGLRAICRSVSIPVIAIGGVDAANAGACIEVGAAGVAVVRAARDAAAVRGAVDAAL